MAVKLEYVDKRSIHFPRMDFYPNGITLPNEKIGNIIKVSKGEVKTLLKLKNGNRPCYKEIPTEKPKCVKAERKEETKEVKDGSR